MAIEYFNAYHSYLKSIEPLNDAERGRLFTALLEYSATGAAPDLRGNERFIFPTMKEQIDRDVEKYNAKCDRNRENVLRRYTNVNERIRTSTKSTKEKAKEKEKTKEKANISPPLSPSQGETGFGDRLQEAFESWLRYKQEKRQSYKPEGLQSLITQIRKHADTYGEEAVADLIGECKAANWQGIIFDRLKGKEKKGGQYGGDRSDSKPPICASTYV